MTLQASDYKLLTSKHCIDNNLHCHCLTDKALTKVANEVKASKYCRSELSAANKWIEDHKADDIKLPWYKDGYFIVGGMMVSFSFGGLAYYLISK